MIFLFDLDSTLVNGEWCDRLADRKWLGEEISSITQDTMDGNIDFNTAFPYKKKLLAPSMEELKLLWKRYSNTLIPWIQTILETLSTQGHTLWIITQWYQVSAEYLCSILPISNDWIRWLSFEHDTSWAFVSFPDQILKQEHGKWTIIQSVKKKYPDEKVRFIWDSRWDYQNGQHADQFIWRWVVRKRKKVFEKSEICIESLEQFQTLLDQIV